MKGIHFTEYTWAEVRNVVTKADKELGQIIDDWDPGKEYTFIELHYPFGSHILDVKKDGFQIPKEDGKTIPFIDPVIPSTLRNKLSYSILPLGIITEGGVEIYHKLNDRVFSLVYFKNGFDLGIWEAFGPPAPYSAVAGARSLIMAPKISDKEQHKKLKKQFGLRQPVPRTLFDQWNIFVELSKHMKKPWKVTVLFLSNKWMQPNKKNIGWLNFYNYLQKKAWQHTEYARDKLMSEVTWKEFCNMLQRNGERFDPYLIETAKHIVSICQGILPGFAAVGKNELHGPTLFLMDIYEHIYGLKNYVPTILAPTHYGRTFKQPVPVYYSFQDSILLDSVPKVRTFSSAVDDMRNFKALMEYFIEENRRGKLETGNNSLFTNINFDYFHSQMHTYGGIQPSSELPKYDENLLYAPGDREPRQFSETGSFFRCCLRLSPSK